MEVEVTQADCVRCGEPYRGHMVESWRKGPDGKSEVSGVIMTHFDLVMVEVADRTEQAYEFCVFDLKWSCDTSGQVGDRY